MDMGLWLGGLIGGVAIGGCWGGDMRCLFRACKWVFICNVAGLGLYQCQRCKTLSVGSPDGPHNKR